MPELVFTRTPEEFGLRRITVVEEIASRWSASEKCYFCGDKCDVSHWHLRTRIRGRDTNRKVYYHRECCPICEELS